MTQLRAEASPPTRVIACPNPACLTEWEETGAEEAIHALRTMIREVTPALSLL